MRTVLLAMVVGIWLATQSSANAQETIRMIGSAADRNVVITKLPFEEGDESEFERTAYRSFGGSYGYRPYRYNYRSYSYRGWRGGYGGYGGFNNFNYGGTPYYGYGNGGYGRYGGFGYGYNPTSSFSYYGRPGVGFYYGAWPN